MSESATPDDDIDYLPGVVRATEAAEEDWPEDDDLEETPLPAGRARPVPAGSSPPAPTWPSAPKTDPARAALGVVPTPAAPEPDVRIGLWGAPRSGKTTYLSALSIATKEPVMGHRWSISGTDRASSVFLDESVKRFVRDKDFPKPTRGYGTLSWKFEGTRHRDHSGKLGKLGRILSGNSSDIDLEFVLEMQDAAGEIFGERAAEEYHEGVMRHLMKADAIVYVFDPLLNEEADTKTFDFFFETLSRLKRGMRESGRLSGSRLPHFVAVCVTKFDDPKVFHAAMEEGIVSQEHEDSMPVVPASIAGEFLRKLCHDDGSNYVCDLLEQEFVPGRVQYFATSSVGFRLKNGRFDPQDFSNVTSDGLHFRSAAQPINVLEPVISLHRRVRGNSGVV
ncbi:hypothetical protein [Lentzea sp. NPDC003310]|uniref:hypothetical protein n=1 Tax=Lentzea sp. NPDC003310 TaxID=3154447 RepID=UPI0033B77B39